MVSWARRLALRMSRANNRLERACKKIRQQIAHGPEVRLIDSTEPQFKVYCLSFSASDPQSGERSEKVSGDPKKCREPKSDFCASMCPI